MRWRSAVPYLASRVKPFADLFDKKALLPVDDDAALDRMLKELAASPRAFEAEARRGRTQFLSEFSYGVNAARLKLVVDEAHEATSEDNDRQIGRVLEKIFQHAGVDYPHSARRKAVAAPAVKRDPKPRDLVFFWKQNDSDIYGRRSDMLVKYLVKSGKVRRVFHFDRSLTLGELEATIDRGPHAPLHQGNLIYLNSMRRIFKMADRGSVIRRTFLCRNGSIPQSFLGMDLPPRAAYVDFVKDTLKECGVDQPPLAWVCPVVFDFPKVHENIKFERTVVDIIDDQRKWQGKTDYMNKVAQNYIDVLKAADVVLANCDPVRNGFANLRADIKIVPNGTEVFAPDRTWPMPEDLADLPRPIVGYVGNLRDRIDFDLIRNMALRHPGMVDRADRLGAWRARRAHAGGNSQHQADGRASLRRGGELYPQLRRRDDAAYLKRADGEHESAQALCLLRARRSGRHDRGRQYQRHRPLCLGGEQP